VLRIAISHGVAVIWCVFFSLLARAQAPLPIERVPLFNLVVHEKEKPPDVPLPTTDFSILEGCGRQKPPDPTEATLIFRDGSRLRGHLAGFDGGMIQWVIPTAPVPLEIRCDTIGTILIPPAAPPAASQNKSQQKTKLAPPGTVRFADGSWLYGILRQQKKSDRRELIIASGKSIFFPAAGTMPQSQSDVAVPTSCGFHGVPEEVVPWTDATDAGIRFDKGVLVAQGRTLNQLVAIPPRCCITAEIPAGAEEGLVMALVPVAAGITEPGKGVRGEIDLEFGPHHFSCQLISRVPCKAEQTGFAHTPVAQLFHQYGFYLDDGERHLIGYRDGEKIIDWKYSAEDAYSHQSGTIISIRNQYDHELKIRSFALKPWDGAHPEIPPRFEVTDTLADATVSGNVIVSTEGVKDAPGHHAPAAAPAKGDRAEPSAAVHFGGAGQVNVTSLSVRAGVVQTAFHHAQKEFEFPLHAMSSLTFSSRSESWQPGAALLFKDGQELPGEFVGAADHGILWKPMGGREVRFEDTNVAGIRFAREDLATRLPEAIVTLSNGDRIFGRSLAIRDGTLSLQQDLLGPIQLSLEKIWRLTPLPHGGGGNCLASAGWLAEANGAQLEAVRRMQDVPTQWKFCDGSFYPYRGSLLGESNGTDLWLIPPIPKLPPSFDFHAEQVSPNPARPIVLIAMVSESGAFTYFECHEGYVEIRTKTDRDIVPLESGTLFGIRTGIHVLADATRKKIALYLNGMPFAEAAMEEPIAKIGMKMADGYTYRNVSISPLCPADPGHKPEGLAIYLQNGDIADGQPVAIKDGNLVATTKDGDFELPLERIATVDFNKPSTPGPAVARLNLKDGSTLELSQWSRHGDGISGVSPQIGPVNIPIDALNDLVLNPPLASFPEPIQPGKMPRKTQGFRAFPGGMGWRHGVIPPKR